MEERTGGVTGSESQGERERAEKKGKELMKETIRKREKMDEERNIRDRSEEVERKAMRG